MATTTHELHYPEYAFEKSFDEESFLKWIQENWTLAFWYSGLYVMVILGGKYYMAGRQRFEIRPALALWSAILAIFSICGAVRTIPETVAAINKYGFEYSICNPSYFYHGVTRFWAFMFTISKVYELGDTIFIVLRKQQLIFLHWYHHISVLIYVWYSYTDHTAPGRWFMIMNYTVHSFMYTYYTLRALRFNIPKWVNIGITAMQISQMIMGLVINIWSYNVKTRGDYCQQSYDNLKWSCMMYFSYFVLFAHFFYQAYFTPKPKMELTKNGVAKKIQ